MNLEQTITESINLHNFEWYKSIQNEFISYPGYDSVHEELEMEFEVEEDVPIQIGMDNSTIEYEKSVSYKYTNVSVNQYCWGIDNPNYVSEYVVLKKVLILS